jgi:mannosyltransferase OCH1-like enzyme
MIPKIIHYVWVGGNQKDYLTLKCIESWKKYFSDYEIIEWNNDNIPLNVDYVKHAFENRKWSNVSNYIRLHALIEHGGIYFDTDFEVIKPFDFLDGISSFLGYESNEPLVNSAVLGAKPNSEFLKECLAFLVNNFDGLEESNLSGPVLATQVLKKHGLTDISQHKINEVTIFPEHYFYPYPWNKPFSYSCITPKTYGIHFWAMSWAIDESKTNINKLEAKVEQYNLRSKSICNLFRVVLKILYQKVVGKIAGFKNK